MSSLAVHDRRFGVEIECGLPGGCGKARDLLTKAGLEPWCYNIHPDGSGVEICSPILQGERGMHELRQVYDILRSNDGFVTGSDGMHIHHDAPEYLSDRDAVIRIVETWAANQELIDELVHFSRRDSWACQKTWTENNINTLKAQGSGYYVGGRGALNISALQEHGTIEFRQHEGTLDFDVASAWIRFGQALMAAALRRDTPLLTCATPKEMLYRIRTDREATAILLSKNTNNSLDAPHARGEECECSDCYDSSYDYDDYGDEPDPFEW